MGEIAFAVIKSKPMKMGQVTNISKNGLAFHYIDRRNGSSSLFKMDILFAGEAFYLDRMLFKPVFDIKIETDIPLNSFSVRKCGVQFGELNHRQRSQLEYFIRNHTVDPAEFKPGFRPWNNAGLMRSKPHEIVESIV